jgi:hypothetical protein
LEVDTESYKKECETISKKGLFQDCAGGILYVFWLSIVFCEYKISHAGKNMSFAGGGPIPFSINMDGNTDGNNCSKIICANTIEEYAINMTHCYFGHTPPAKIDNFIRMYMDHQHYFKGSDNGDPCLKGSYDYEPYPKCYKTPNGGIIDGNDLPEHFTFLLDWTECRSVAEKFTKSGGTIVSINEEKYERIVGDTYRYRRFSKECSNFLAVDIYHKRTGKE